MQFCACSVESIAFLISVKISAQAQKLAHAQKRYDSDEFPVPGMATLDDVMRLDATIFRGIVCHCKQHG